MRVHVGGAPDRPTRDGGDETVVGTLSGDRRRPDIDWRRQLVSPPLDSGPARSHDNGCVSSLGDRGTMHLTQLYALC